MHEKLKIVAGLALWLAVVLGFVALPFIFIKGAIWASENVLPTLFAVGWITLAVVILILLPLSLVRRFRGFTGAGIFFSSYVFGLICWLTGFVVTYAFWGIWGVIIGVLFLGGGVVPIGMIAALFKGEWGTLVMLTGLVVLTFGTRLLGDHIAERGE